MLDAYAGIDVAFAKKKRLPVVVCTFQDGRLEPFPLRRAAAKPPRGHGNACILDKEIILAFAEETASYLRCLESEFGIQIQRIAIDAPSQPKTTGLRRRVCEVGLDQRQISCITTPSEDGFEAICKMATEHLRSGGSQPTIPGANQLWMLVGFELFRRLGVDWECIEIFPQAIAALLDVHHIHKSQQNGVIKQLTAVARRTQWPVKADVTSLVDIGYGSLHDRLDAYMAAWMAALDNGDRMAIGQAPHDVIWVPRLEGKS